VMASCVATPGMRYHTSRRRQRSSRLRTPLAPQLLLSQPRFHLGRCNKTVNRVVIGLYRLAANCGESLIGVCEILGIRRKDSLLAFKLDCWIKFRPKSILQLTEDLGPKPRGVAVPTICSLRFLKARSRKFDSVCECLYT
jgi:hypothetical protein